MKFPNIGISKKKMEIIGRKKKKQKRFFRKK